MDCGWLAYDGARTPGGMTWVGGDSAAKYKYSKAVRPDGE
jgi:hypothetical protein